ncbi:AMP-binding protein [uncultured Sneathiella sp.]|uniref:AMP-binding protein n=1 Tax=uncultured Sneathiella sp. TaxID=879315 RepID=UPI0030EF9ECC|tara:strand:+ start:6561 stop:8174 length:1614 start_codon:yes stop_codon:yes gene_type:complete
MDSEKGHHFKVKLPPMMERTLSAVMKTAVQNTPNKMALRDPMRELTYSELVNEGLSIAGALIDLGLERQQPLLAMLDNTADFVSLSMGLGLTARIEVPVNTAYRGSILAHVIKTTNAKIMILEDKYLERLAEIPDDLEVLDIVIVRGKITSEPNIPSRIKLIEFSNLSLRLEEMEDVKPWDIISVIYTSGTTGPSKGAMIAHAQAYGYASIVQQDVVTPEDVSLVVLPLFHVTAKWGGVYGAFVYNGSVVVLPNFSASTYWDSARKYNCTCTRMLGTIAQFLLNQPERPDDKSQPIKKIGITPIIADLEKFKERFGVSGVLTAYGSTEASVVSAVPIGKGIPGYAGFIRDDIEVRIVDEHDMEVPSGEIGELIVRPKEPWMTMQGYVNMPEATNKALRNGWFHTGDLLRVAPNGQLVFCDRNNDAIRRKGENISSFEIEREINAHPAVFESAAIKVASDHTDDDVKACVALRPGQSVSPEELITFLVPRMPKFMLPRYVEFLEALPKTPTEKVLKAELRKNSLNQKTYDCENNRFVE